MVREIVGVARQVKGRPDETEDLVQIYVPMAQNIARRHLSRRAARRQVAPKRCASSVRAAIGRVDKEQLVSVQDVMTLEDVAWEATARHRFRAVMVMTFAGLALLLAMVGVFGILAYSVQQRVRDFGVRRALGATTGDVLRLVVGSAVRVIAAGAVIGLLLVGGPRPAADDDAVRRAAPGPGDVCRGDRQLRAHRRGVDCRPGLACGAHRPGRGAAQQVTRHRARTAQRSFAAAERGLSRTSSTEARTTSSAADA